VAHLAGDRVKREAMGEAGRLRVAPLSWASLTDQLLAHYSSAQQSRSLAG
jgi:phosphatidylinositol alpha 1,6-mannosyltransferase